MRRLGILILLLAGVQSALAQYYPRWFIEQENLPCARSAVGYSPLWLNKDSAVAHAARNARTNLVRERQTVVELGQAFWTTEAGTAWMGGEVKVSIDSSAYLQAVADTGAVAASFCPDFVIALSLDGSCKVPDSMKEIVRMPGDQPGWVRETPQSISSYYCVGVAPRYFYEMSSWEGAERMALLGLAKVGGDSLAAIEKSAAGSGQEVLNEHVWVVIRDYRVMARWCDEANGVFYVLVSVRKDGIESQPVQTGMN